MQHIKAFSQNELSKTSDAFDIFTTDASRIIIKGLIQLYKPKMPTLKTRNTLCHI